jgi:catechol 2,3-dioxygenase-like lactoylglutathione lyase family enzyme
MEKAPPPFDRRRTEAFLLSCGAAQLAHPGGSLYEHVRRVADLLRDWGAGQVVQAAGLCHACYGTDGYDHPLLDVGQRGKLAELIGPGAESLVYLYASCDRGAVYPGLAGTGPVPFRDRFTGRTFTPPEPRIRAFAELTAANELDLVRHSPELAARHEAGLLDLFTRVRRLLSDAAWDACSELRGPPVRISNLDHLVLTVTDPDQTIGFYQRVFGMQAVTFGSGRHALAFGPSKINLHQTGHEITPHAACPAPGSTDLCLVTTAPPDRVLAHLAACQITVEAGPVPRTGALGPITSVYIRDPDGNLLEIASYDTRPASR